ncbi:MAG: helix-turn-helix transcriptional regulator [Methylocystaceae bacterium]|nr:helix-turn-helix transcriptional regulator [Methylocystaceae bacterium]
MDLKHSLGARVRAFRQLRNLTQEQVAAEVERTPEAISNIERGRSLPSLETLDRLARVMGIPLVEFFEQERTGLTRQRIEQEAKLRILSQSLGDEDLEIALGQAEVLHKVRARTTLS